MEDVISETFIMNALCKTAALQFNKELGDSAKCPQKALIHNCSKDAEGLVAGMFVR
jgi:hypothetical protein